MANWNLPTITSGYLDFVTQMNDKFVDSATLLAGAPTNLPNASIRYNRTTNIFEEWDLATWNPKVIGILGGGTGSNTAAGARTSLGLGSMATQNSNAVNITGGSISGVNFDASGITAGVVALARGGTGASLALPAAGWTFVSNGAQMVMDSGVSIAQLNASNLSTGIVPDARLSGNIPKLNGTNIFSGPNIFTSTVTVQGSNPYIQFYDAAMPANQRYIKIINSSGYMLFQSMNDDGSGATNLMYVYRNGSFTATYLTGNGAGITGLNASNINAGVVNPAFLGSGGANSSTFLRGDNVWAVPPAGGGSVVNVPSGLIAIFDVGCPAGWTRYPYLDGRFPLGSTGMGSVGGSTQHQHGFNVWSDSRGSHGHSVDLSGGSGTAHVIGDTGDNSDSQTVGLSGSTWAVARHVHHHHFDVYADVYNLHLAGSTGGVGDHNHNVYGNTDNFDGWQPYMTVVWCRKD